MVGGFWRWAMVIPGKSISGIVLVFANYHCPMRVDEQRTLLGVWQNFTIESRLGYLSVQARESSFLDCPRQLAHETTHLKFAVDWPEEMNHFSSPLNPIHSEGHSEMGDLLVCSVWQRPFHTLMVLSVFGRSTCI